MTAATAVAMMEEVAESSRRKQLGKRRAVSDYWINGGEYVGLQDGGSVVVADLFCGVFA